MNNEALSLRERVLEALASQGFVPNGDRLSPLPNAADPKEAIRRLHIRARETAIRKAEGNLRRHEDRLLRYFARGDEVHPERLRPVLVPVRAGSEEELLFRYARLLWSVPSSAGYGRRLRFVVFDESCGKLIGIIGLGDPVFSLRPRDAWVGWNKEQRRRRLCSVMDAFVLGAVPPYSYLTCGKLMALLAVSDEVREAFRQKYAGTISRILERPFDGHWVLLTTVSALGRSSLYNRLTFQDRKVYISVGFTSGSGEFHFANGLYRDLVAFLQRERKPQAKHPRWGKGWRSRREVVRSVLPLLGLPRDFIYHGVAREVFVAPLARNAREFLLGQTSEPDYYSMPASEIFAWFRQRWLLPRAQRDARYRFFDPETIRLWGD